MTTIINLPSCPYIDAIITILVALLIMLIGITVYFTSGTINALYWTSGFAGCWIIYVLGINYDYYNTQPCQDKFKKDELNSIYGTSKRDLKISKKENRDRTYV